jgi:hypothetical protein
VALTAFAQSMPGQAQECGSRSPSAQKGEKYYADIAVEPLSDRDYQTVEDFFESLKRLWRGEGEVLRCNGDSQQRAAELELRVEGSPRDDYQIKKETRDVDRKTLRYDTYVLRVRDHVYQLDAQGDIEFLQISDAALVFRAKFKVRANLNNVISNEIIWSLRRHGEVLEYDERRFTQGRLTWAGHWRLHRIF